MKCFASPAPVMNHLRPVMRQPPAMRSARVYMSDGSEPAPPSGSVIANDERTSPATIGASQRSFCAGVAIFESTVMFPSSGAAQLKLTGPKIERPISSYSTAISATEQPSPPSARGSCGVQRPRRFTSSRSGFEMLGVDVLVLVVRGGIRFERDHAFVDERAHRGALRLEFGEGVRFTA